MKTSTLTITILATCLTHSFALPGGSITPPGAPGQTMKSLDEIEPRVPIIDGAPGVTINGDGTVTISTSGSYYLTDDLIINSSNASGIVISTQSVTLDLNGFTISGVASSISYSGILVQSDNASIRNGSINGFGNSITLNTADSCRISDIRSIDANEHGIYINASHGNDIQNCSIRGADESGILVNGNAGNANNNRISDSIILDSLSGIIIDGQNGGNAINNTVIDCKIDNTYNSSIHINGSSGNASSNQIKGCALSKSTGFMGVYLTGNNGIANNNVVSACSISNILAIGIYIYAGDGEAKGNRIIGNTIYDTGAFGIQLQESTLGECRGNLVLNNSIHDFVTTGIYMFSVRQNRVEGNQISGPPQSFGIRAFNTIDNLIIKNFVTGQTTNYSIDPDDTYGPLVTSSGSLATTGASAHPMANFSL